MTVELYHKQQRITHQCCIINNNGESESVQLLYYIFDAIRETICARLLAARVDKSCVYIYMCARARDIRASGTHIVRNSPARNTHTYDIYSAVWSDVARGPQRSKLPSMRAEREPGQQRHVFCFFTPAPFISAGAQCGPDLTHLSAHNALSRRPCRARGGGRPPHSTYIRGGISSSAGAKPFQCTHNTSAHIYIHYIYTRPQTREREERD